MSVSVPSPPPFLPHVGEALIPFKTLGKIFDNYQLKHQRMHHHWTVAKKTVTSNNVCASDVALVNIWLTVKNCPVATVRCNNCGKKGHLAMIFRSPVSKVREVVVPELAVLCIDDIAAYSKITCDVKIEVPQENSQVLELIVDTGASVCILPETLYRQYFANCPLTELKVKLVTYAKAKVPVIGCLPAAVNIANQTNKVPAFFYIVKAGSPLMGLDLIKVVSISIVGGKVNTSKNKVYSVTALNQKCTVYNVHSAASCHLGCVKWFIHKVQVNNTVQPVRQKLRLLPLSICKEVSAELNHFLQAGIIERVDASEWVSPLVVARKLRGSLRLCVDLCEPNKSVIMDCHPLPHMEDLSKLAGPTHYSQLDLSSAYHQPPLHPESRNLPAFITHDGLFRFTQVPFGLASVPSAFQKMMQTILKGLSVVHNYLDDIIFYRDSKEMHDRHFQAVLQRLRDACLQMNFEKS